jgi:hypothetical protein
MGENGCTKDLKYCFPQCPELVPLPYNPPTSSVTGTNDILHNPFCINENSANYSTSLVRKIRTGVSYQYDKSYIKLYDLIIRYSQYSYFISS